MLLHRVSTFLKLAVVSSIVSIIAFMSIPLCFAFGDEKKGFLTIIVASVFWGGLLIEQVFLLMANYGRKKIQRSAQKLRPIEIKTIGLLKFGANREAFVCDISLAFFVVTTSLLLIFDIQHDLLVISSLAGLLLSFNLHCIFNGKNYTYIKAFRKIRDKSGN